MSESAVQLSDTIKEHHPDIDWRGIRGFRNIVVHGYVETLDLALTWTYIESEVDALGRAAVSELTGSA
jgi:uncharacterized protein with HEPN domain